MEQVDAGRNSETNGSSWPWSSMFWLGTFGKETPAGRIYHRRAYGALIGLVVGVALAAIVEKYAHLPVWRLAAGVGTPLVFGYIFWSFLRYLHELDELARQVQYEAVLFSLLCILMGGLVLTSVWMFTGWAAHPIWVLVAEPLRGVGLLIAARRYR